MLIFQLLYMVTDVPVITQEHLRIDFIFIGLPGYKKSFIKLIKATDSFLNN